MKNGITHIKLSTGQVQSCVLCVDSTNNCLSILWQLWVEWTY